MRGAGVWGYMVHSASLTNILLWWWIHPCRARCPAHRGAGCSGWGRIWKVLWNKKRQQGLDLGGHCVPVVVLKMNSRNAALWVWCKSALMSSAAFWALSAASGWVSPPGLSVLGSDAFCSTLRKKNEPEFLISGAMVAVFTVSFFTSWWMLGRQVRCSDSLSLCHAQTLPHQSGYQHKVHIYKLQRQVIMGKAAGALQHCSLLNPHSWGFSSLPFSSSTVKHKGLGLCFHLLEFFRVHITVSLNSVRRVGELKALAELGFIGRLTAW